MKYSGHIVNILNRNIFDGEVIVEGGKINSVHASAAVPENAPYIMPGFIDSHVHIESSMMLPSALAKVVVKSGTIGVVSDPHEIANVLGVDGVDYMIENGKTCMFNFCFGAPSCVPSCSTDIETSGAVINSTQIAEMLKRPEIGYLSEMMNFPGVFSSDPEVMAKIQAAKDCGKPIDGHAPGLLGDDRRRYASAGISTDHECSSIEEARDCILSGMKVLIREGSAARNYDALIHVLREYPDSVMFCTDDCHPDDLVRGHINTIVAEALADGYDLWDVLRAASLNPQLHYNLDWGLLREGDPANFILVDNLSHDFKVLTTVINGEEVYSINNTTPETSNSKSSKDTPAINSAPAETYPNHFLAKPISASDIATVINAGDTIHVIRAFDGSLLTEKESLTVLDDVTSTNEWLSSDIQKIVVYNRYTEGAKPVVAYIRGFGITNGAIAGSVAHDCHNIVAIGSSDEYLLRAINRIVEMKGGQVAICEDEQTEIPLPVAGILSPLDAEEIAHRTLYLHETARRAGCTFNSPFITMAFMSLPVIPKLKLTDRGLFDCSSWQFLEK